MIIYTIVVIPCSIHTMWNQMVHILVTQVAYGDFIPSRSEICTLGPPNILRSEVVGLAGEVQEGEEHWCLQHTIA